MRRTVYKRGVIAVFLAALWICGCSSSSDPVDELDWRWRVSGTTVFDGSEERFLVDPTTVEDAYISVEFVSNEEVEYDVWLNEVTLEFEGEPEIPAQRYEVDDDLLSAAGGTLTENLYFMPAGFKIAYLEDEIGGEAAAETFSAYYSVNITARFSFSRGSGDNDVTLTDSIFFTIAKPEEEEEE